MNRDPHEIWAEAEAIRQLLEIAKAATATKSHAQFLSAKVESGARRLDVVANTTESQKGRRHG